MRTRYRHTNIVAENWRRLTDFYERVIGCRPVPPERASSAEWVERSTGVPGGAVRGIHLRLPGFGDDGPTVEIFQYNNAEKSESKAVNRPGFAHMAFEVDDVEAARDEVLAAGGDCVGEMVTAEIADAGTITFIYMTDPEGNIIELQKWA
ncbi:MAG: VOC family protein [Planctomycetota bacterium]|jgi:predicted enzyme related to lactoylglutathione lyase